MLFYIIFDKNCEIRVGAVTCMGWGWRRFKESKSQSLRLKNLPCHLVYAIGAKMQLPPCPPWAELAPSAVWMTGGGLSRCARVEGFRLCLLCQ